MRAARHDRVRSALLKSGMMTLLTGLAMPSLSAWPAHRMRSAGQGLARTVGNARSAQGQPVAADGDSGPESRSPMSRLPATIVIPVWNQWELTRACLESLRPTLGV